MSNEQMKDLKLSAARQEVYNTMMKLLERDDLSWVKEWQGSDTPVSFSTEKAYRGSNEFILSIVSSLRGYSDNRWLTFNQLQKAGLRFKQDENGKSLATKQGVPIEFFSFYDKSTKKPLDWKKFNEMDKEEQFDYWTKNVKPVSQNYTVFNCSLVENCPAAKMVRPTISDADRDERADKLLDTWSREESKITEDGGNRAYYSISSDKIHTPEKSAFFNLTSFYGTNFHEVGHSTGAKHRLNREGIANFAGFGSKSYAAEELVAEISSVFVCKELGLALDENHLKNHAAYIQSWREIIRENPQALFTAFSQANRAASLILEKENISASGNTKDVSGSSSASSEDSMTKDEFLAMAGEYNLSETDIKALRNSNDSLVGVQMLDDGNSQSLKQQETSGGLRFSRLSEEDHDDRTKRSNLSAMVSNIPARKAQQAPASKVAADENVMINSKG